MRICWSTSIGWWAPITTSIRIRRTPCRRCPSGPRVTAAARCVGTFTEDHIVAISEAIARYRVAEGIDGPLFLGRDTHALSEPAFRTAVEVLVAHGIDVAVDSEGGYTPTPAISHAILTHNARGGATADGIVITPSHNPPEDGGFKYNPPHGGPADTGVTRQIQDAANELLRARLRGARRLSYDKAIQARPAVRLPLRVRRRLGGRGRPGRDRGRRDSGSGSIRWAARASRTGRRSQAATSSTSR